MITRNEKYKFIGGRIKSAREAVGLSQKDLAEAIGYESATAISLIEAGERKVSIVDLEKIATKLNHNVDYFLGTEEKVDFLYALRTDKDLTTSDQEKVLDFVDFIKSKRHGKRKDQAPD